MADESTKIYLNINTQYIIYIEDKWAVLPYKHLALHQSYYSGSRCWHLKKIYKYIDCLFLINELEI